MTLSAKALIRRFAPPSPGGEGVRPFSLREKVAGEARRMRAVAAPPLR